MWRHVIQAACSEDSDLQHLTVPGFEHRTHLEGNRTANIAIFKMGHDLEQVVATRVLKASERPRLIACVYQVRKNTLLLQGLSQSWHVIM